MSHGGGSRGTRRAFLSSLAAVPLAAQSNKKRTLPKEWGRFADPATEFEVVRLTSPEHTSYLPPYYNRCVSHRSQFLIFTSDRGGSDQLFRLDLKSGEWLQLTDAAALDHRSVALLGSDRAVCYFDGASLRYLQLNNLRERELYRVPDGFERCAGATASGDARFVFFGEKREGRSRLQRVPLGKGAASPITEAPFELSHPQARPRRDQVLYRQGDQALWLVDWNGANHRQLKTAAGGIGPAFWAPRGRTLLYLSFPEEPGKLNAIREHTPDENADQQVANTSQYVHFGCNGDASVFVGASRNGASPHLLLMVRLARREMTICEHKASNPAIVAPVFSPDSQFVFFQTDRDGKLAIYRMAVDKLVEKTEDET